MNNPHCPAGPWRIWCSRGRGTRAAKHQVRGAVAPGCLARLPASMWAEGDAVGLDRTQTSSGLFVPGEGPGHWPGATCKAKQRPGRAGLVRIGIVVSHLSRTLLFD